MNRYLVYVNHHDTAQHITIHHESKKACSDIFMHVKQGGAQAAAFPITKINPTTFKTGEVDNSYWLIIWSKKESNVLKYAQTVAALHGITRIKVCKKCK